MTRTAWPSGLRRWLQAPVRKGVGPSHTAVLSGTTCNGTVLLAQHTRCIFSTPKTLSTKHPKSSRYSLTFILNYLTALPQAPRHFPRSYHNLFRSPLLHRCPQACHFLGGTRCLVPGNIEFLTRTAWPSPACLAHCQTKKAG